MLDYYAISVRKFAEILFRDENIESSGSIASVENALMGTHLHRKFEKFRENEISGYKSEVPVVSSFTYEADPELTFTLQGRCDGMFIEGDVITVDEIKTCCDFPEKVQYVHYIQCALYAALYMKSDESLKSCVLNVIYLSRNSKTELSSFFTNRLSREEALELLGSCVDFYMDWLYKVRQSKIKLLDEIRSFGFPYGEFRKGQREVSVGVYKTVTGRQKALCINAPTGIGKTAGVLFPAIKALESARGKMFGKIFYLTSKNDGSTPVLSFLEFCESNMPSLCAVFIFAKEKSCINSEFECDADKCAFAKGYGLRIGDAVNKAFGEIGIFTRERILSLAEEFQVCPFELSLEISLFCDIIVCDYNYFYDPVVYLKRFFDKSEEPFIILCDEAHNLPSRVSDMYTISVSADSCELFAKKKGRRKDYNQIRKAAKAIKGLTEDIPEDSDYYCYSGTPDIIKEALTDFTDKVTELSSKGIKYSNEEINFFFEITRFLKIVSLSDINHFSYYITGESGGTFNVQCTDPSLIISDKTNEVISTFYFSGTLLPKDYFIRSFGRDDTPYIMVDSPFPKDNSLVVSSFDISTKYSEREKNYSLISDIISQFAFKCPSGNYMVFFSSFAFLGKVYELLDDEAKEFVVIQPKSGSPDERNGFINGFEINPKFRRIGFCVLGGSFSEGIDLIGDRLSGSIIIGLGLPMVSTERELIKKTYDSLYGTGFDDAYVNPGINKIVQAAGRVIRSDTDRGFIWFIDSRFQYSKYRMKLPQYMDVEYYKKSEDALDKILNWFGNNL